MELSENERADLIRAWPWPTEAAVTATGFADVCTAVERIIAARMAQALEDAAEAFNVEGVGFQQAWGSNPADQQTINALAKALAWLRDRASALRDEAGR